MVTWVVFISRLLGIMQRSSWECLYLIEILFSFSLGIYLEVEFLGHIIHLFLIFWGNSILFSIVAAPIHTPTNSAWRFPFLDILAKTSYFLSFDDSHYDRYEVIPHCGLHLHFSDDYWCWASFHISIGHFYVLFREMSLLFFCPFFNWIFLWLSLLTLCILDVNPLSG